MPYLAITLAYRLPEIFTRVNGHDFSYGLYLYAFPVQQTISQFMPHVKENWLLALVLSTIISGLLALISWYFIEKPSLAFKSRYAKKVEI